MNPQYSPVKDVLTKLYAMPFFQRAYKWEQKQIGELIEDLQRAFLESYDTSHARRDVSRYNEYFLGSVITTDSDPSSEDKARRLLIDGHQRLTSLTLLLCYLHNKNENRFEIDNLIEKFVCSLAYGERTFQIKSENDRKTAMEKIISGHAADFSMTKEYEKLEDSARNIIDRFLDIDMLIDEDLTNNLLPFFTDWISQKVYLIDIQSASEHQAHRIFVTMNDRGLHLSPLDMMKGNILASITDSGMRQRALASWEKITLAAAKYGREEMASFIKSLLRARYASTMRDKTAGEAKDFELIGDQYHKWTSYNLELKGAQGYYDFTTKTLPKYFSIYKTILDSSQNYTNKYPHIFFNAKRNSTIQILPILAAISEADTDIQQEEKISLVTKYIDLYLTARQVNRQEVNYDSLREPIFRLSKEIRNKSHEQIKFTIEPLSKSAIEDIKKIKSVTYNTHKTPAILYILSRIADYLETSSKDDGAIGFAKYIDRKRSDYSYDVEHILSDKFEDHKHATSAGGSFSSKREFEELRNNIGNLILLPRSKNRSYNALAYAEKSDFYKTDNILSKTLCKTYYERNTKLKKYLEESGIKLSPIERFTKASIEERANVYLDIAQKIWS